MMVTLQGQMKAREMIKHEELVESCWGIEQAYTAVNPQVSIYFIRVPQTWIVSLRGRAKWGVKTESSWPGTQRATASSDKTSGKTGSVEETELEDAINAWNRNWLCEADFFCQYSAWRQKQPNLNLPYDLRNTHCTSNKADKSF